MVITALEAGRGQTFSYNRPKGDRRDVARLQHRAVAHIRLFADAEGTDAWVVYTRDIDHQGIGFVSREPLPLGFKGIVEMMGPDDQPFSAACTVHRSRSCGEGWYEGALFFHNRRPDLVVPMRLCDSDMD
ncbi:MAG: hypothetical protein AAGD32_05070 [Planctomycetota bacterium]